MSDHERYGFRDNAYSAWHRPNSISRYIDKETAEEMRLIDLDAILGEDMRLLESEGNTWIEFGRYSSWPLALIETAVDVDQPDKYANVTMNMARISDLPGAVALYKLSDLPNPADRRAQDIEAFRLRRLWPNPENGFRNLSPQEYAEALIRGREAGAKRWRQFIGDEHLRKRAKQVWEALEEERERSRELLRALEQEKEKSRELMLAIEAERKKTRKKTEVRSELRLPLFPIEEPPF